MSTDALAAAPVGAPPRRHRPLVALVGAALGLWRTRVGVVLVLVLVGIALIGPFFSPYAPDDFVGAPNEGPSSTAQLGTDRLGQDVLSRFLWGGRSVLALSTLATALGLVLGVPIGLAAAYARGYLDDVLMRTMDVILAFPQIMLALVVIAMLGASDWLIVLTVGLTTMPRIARVTRGAALAVVERDFVHAADALGESRSRILFSEVLPNVVSPLMVEATLRLTYSIGLIAALAFLGFSSNPNGADWGLMINENQAALTTQPWGVVTPVLAIAVLTIGTSLIGDGLSRAAIGVERRTGGE